MPFRHAFSPNGADEEDEHELEALFAARDEFDANGASSEWSVDGAGRQTHAAIDLDAMEEDEAPADDDDEQLAHLDDEIAQIDEQLATLQQLRDSLFDERKELQKKRAASARPVAGPSRQPVSLKSVDYTSSTGWKWAEQVKKTMKEVWGIKSFRSQQEGVVNAVLSGRDVVCIMPTGAGKSLCFQLPALLTPGVTVVISPLIALMQDQVLNLLDLGVEAVALTSASSKSEVESIMKRLEHGGSSRKKGGVRIMNGYEDDDQPEIKLCYITPERLSKNKGLQAALTRMVTAGRVARFVIDESHCVSQLGHDFRPDYKKVSLLRQLYSSVPIVALTATCPPRVLQDMLKMLGLKPPTEGKSADPRGTVIFRAPLYRPNLHWQVLPKPSNAKETLQTLADWIVEHHADETGIVYCLSQKDTETVAEGLLTTSEGAIKTGVYHAGLDDRQKERVHHQWREKKIRVVVATIAFGLGIDKPDVRFVCHHTLSKSLEGLYQEAGRAGRDGNPSDCVMFYRGQDATRIASMLAGDPEGSQKLHSILSYANDLRTCRKVLFSRYFADRSSTAFSSQSGDGKEDESPCNNCDNCTRDPESIEVVDVRVDAWRVLKVLEAVRRHDGRVTNSQLGDLARGLGGGSFNVAEGKKTAKATINVVDLAGAKVSLNKDDTESLITELLLKGYIRDMLHGTAYSVVVYQQPGPNIARLTRLSLKDVEAGNGPKIEIALPARGKKKKKKASKGKETSKASAPKKRKKAEPDPVDSDDELAANESLLPPPSRALHDCDDDDDDENMDDWEEVTTARPTSKPPAAKKARRNEVLELSD